MDGLLELREEIDRIDGQLIPLLVKRMEISKKVADYKLKNGLPVLNEKREAEILSAVSEKCGDKGDAVKAVYSAILDASKSIQNKIIGE